MRDVPCITFPCRFILKDCTSETPHTKEQMIHFAPSWYSECDPIFDPIGLNSDYSIISDQGWKIQIIPESDPMNFLDVQRTFSKIDM
uniref:Neur_chan_LBD domain-containing protein n=1 Tax=Panagrellus redivivus TaxID=6233 RepID=A0A7E4UW75_PANRE